MFTIKFEGTDKIFESDSPISVYEAAKASELIDRSVIAARRQKGRKRLVTK